MRMRSLSRMGVRRVLSRDPMYTPRHIVAESFRSEAQGVSNID